MECCNAPRPTLQTPALFCVTVVCLFVYCIHHRIICIASALVVVIALKLAFAHSCRVPLAFVDRSESNLVLRFPSCLNRSLFAQCIDPSPVSETSPNPHRTIVTVGSGSSPNIYKTSPFSLLDSPSLFFSIVRFKSEGPNIL